MRTTTLFRTLVAQLSTTKVPVPASDPLRGVLGAKFRGDIEISAVNGNAEVALGIQTSDDCVTWTDHTGAGELIVDFKTAGQWHTANVVDLASLTGAAQWFRYVWYVRLSAAGNLATAFVQGQAEAIPRN